MTPENKRVFVTEAFLCATYSFHSPQAHTAIQNPTHVLLAYQIIVIWYSNTSMNVWTPVQNTTVPRVTYI